MLTSVERGRRHVPKNSEPQPLPDELLQEAASTMALLATPVRLHLLWLLSYGEKDVGTLAEAIGQTLPTVSHHLNKLKLAGLVGDRVAGRHRVYMAIDQDAVDLAALVISRRLERKSGRARKRRA